MDEEKGNVEHVEHVVVNSNNHRYRIPILNTIVGVGFAMNYQNLINEKHDKKSLLSEIIKICKKTASLYEVTSMLLAGTQIDDSVCDELGMCDLFRQKPHEIPAALFVVIAANWQSYFPFLDTEPDTEGSP